MNALPLPRRWLLMAAVMLALSFLMANHAPPWTAFHKEAWAALILLLVGAWVFAAASAPVAWGPLTLLAGAASTLPLMQLALGMPLLWGTAWIHALYLAGWAMSLRLGEVWEDAAPGQAADFVFGAVVLAALVSTGLQLHQWLGFEPFGIWTMAAASGRRLYANMAQPNLLASLQLLGLLGLAWAWHRGRLSARWAFVGALVMLVGITLTESRAAWLNLALLYAGMWAGRRLLPTPRLLQVASLLGVVFLILVLLLPWVNQWAGLGDADTAAQGQYRALSDPVRLRIWNMGLEALQLQPWSGYGWGRVSAAQFAVVDAHPDYLLRFSSSHNLVLDLLLWNGLPLGLILTAVLACWWWRRLRRTRDVGQMLRVGFLAVLLVHAMLELPLQYAYFLLPFGLVAGTLHTAQADLTGWRWTRSRALQLSATGGLAIALMVTVVDYFRIEYSYLGLRLENANVPTNIPREPPPVRVLDQFSAYLLLARNTPRAGLAEAELQAMERVVTALPSARVVQRLAQNLALNGHGDQAQHWQRVLCRTFPEPNCSEMRAAWLSDPDYRGVDWP